MEAGRDIHVHIQNAERPSDAVNRLADVAAASPFAGKVAAFLEEYLVAEDGSGTVPFGGRDKELEFLDCWLDDTRRPSRFVLTAPAGRGRGALVVHWLKRLQVKGALGKKKGQWSLVFAPISMRFNTNRPEVFFEAICAQLAHVLGRHIKPAQIDPIAYYEDQCRLMLDEAVAKGRRILLVIDGIDEALSQSHDITWFPRLPKGDLRILITAQLQLGDEDLQRLDSSPWLVDRYPRPDS